MKKNVKFPSINVTKLSSFLFLLICQNSKNIFNYFRFIGFFVTNKHRTKIQNQPTSLKVKRVLKFIRMHSLNITFGNNATGFNIQNLHLSLALSHLHLSLSIR